MIPGGAAGGIAAAAIARRRREIIEAFRNKGATAYERAIPEAEVPHRDNLVFTSLVKRGIVVRTPGGRLYLNETAEARARSLQLRILAALLVAGLIALAWVLGLRSRVP